MKFKLTYISDPNINSMIKFINFKNKKESLIKIFKTKKITYKRKSKENKFFIFQKSNNLKIDLHGLKDQYKSKIKKIKIETKNNINLIKNNALLIDKNSIEIKLTELKDELIFSKRITKDNQKIIEIESQINKIINFQKKFKYDEKQLEQIKEIENNQKK